MFRNYYVVFNRPHYSFPVRTFRCRKQKSTNPGSLGYTWSSNLNKSLDENDADFKALGKLSKAQGRENKNKGSESLMATNAIRFYPDQTIDQTSKTVDTSHIIPKVDIN